MLVLVLGMAVFIAVHLVPTSPDLRRAFAGRMGENAYKAVFSAISLVGLVLIVVGYNKIQLHAGKNPQLWVPPPWGPHVAMGLMLPVFPLLVATYLRGRIAAAVRHPMITAIKLWALAHLFVRGDLASLILFVGFLGWAVYDRISLKHRDGAGAAAARGGPIVNDVIAVVAGLGLYVAFVRWGHAALIGVPLVH